MEVLKYVCYKAMQKKGRIQKYGGMLHLKPPLKTRVVHTGLVKKAVTCVVVPGSAPPVG
jgi:hypothetical protein